MPLAVKEWKPNVVYLVQFPRTKAIPSLSPFALKLETWLRMADIQYENVCNNMKIYSKKGQIPFVELNGEQIADSYFIINQLSQIFHKNLEIHLRPAEVATARAFESLLEQSLFYSLLRQRSENMSGFFVDPLMENASISSFSRPFLAGKFKTMMKTKLLNHGLGRHTMREASDIAEKDFKALSDYLGDKQFMTGNQPTRLDATAFGILSQFWFLPARIQTRLQQFMSSETHNLVEFLEKMKLRFWPDWEEACADLSLETDWRIEEIEGAKYD